MEHDSTSTDLGRKFQLIEIRKLKGDFASVNDYLIFQDKLLSKAINPWRNWSGQAEIPNGIWALIACEHGDTEIYNPVLLDYQKIEFGAVLKTSQPFEGIKKFTEWVKIFNPITWHDWLLIPNLFGLYLRSGQIMPELAATSDPYIDAILRESRGLLMWSHQLNAICNMMKCSDTKSLNYFKFGGDGWQESCRKKHYSPTNQTLLQILEERSVDGHGGSPDYILADWLLSYFGNTI